MAIMNQVVLDFGATPSDRASVVVTGQAGILATSKIEAWVMTSSTAGNDASMHELLNTFANLYVNTIVPGVGFTITANVAAGYFTGQFNIQFVWVV